VAEIKWRRVGGMLEAPLMSQEDLIRLLAQKSTLTKGERPEDFFLKLKSSFYRIG
jgi:hypothetical protein